MSEVSNVTVLSRDLFLKNDFYTLLKFAWSVNKDKLIAIFKENDIDIEKEADLKVLADLHNAGKDKNGFLKDKNKQPMYRDFVMILASESKTTEAEMNKAINERRLVFI